MELITMELPLRIDNEMRMVTVTNRGFMTDRLDTVQQVGFYQKRGGKLWKAAVTFWKQADGSWKASRYGVFLNRGGYTLVAWSDYQSSHVSQHNSAAAA